MSKRSLFLLMFFSFLVCKSYSQGFIINQPRLEIEENKLLIFYDIITKNLSDQFYVWIEIEKADGEKIPAKFLSGDIGANLKAGNNKKIIWTPEQDSVYLDEEIFIVVKAEKYIKSFNKGSMMIRSAVFPGWGQTKISKGKPWWLTGAAVYGALAAGFLYNQKYLQSLDSYRAEEDPIRRDEMLNQTQKQLNISTAFLYSAASAWAINVIWVSFTPNRYQLLQNAKFSFSPIVSPLNSDLLISLKLNF